MIVVAKEPPKAHQSARQLARSETIEPETWMTTGQRKNAERQMGTVLNSTRELSQAQIPVQLRTHCTRTKWRNWPPETWDTGVLAGNDSAGDHHETPWELYLYQSATIKGSLTFANRTLISGSARLTCDAAGLARSDWATLKAIHGALRCETNA